jgi:hypothetical protein
VDANPEMIVRVSAKLGKKIRLGYEQSLPPSPNPFLDWSADLFTANRTQYIIVTNNATLYTMVMFGRGMPDASRFLQGALAEMRHRLESDGFSSALQQIIGPAASRIAIAKRQDRRVIGSMNDLIFQARIRLISGDTSPSETSRYLNRTPMSYIDYSNPRAAFRSMVEQLQRR